MAVILQRIGDSGANQYAYNARGELTSRVIDGTTWTFGWGPEGTLTSASKSGYSAAYLYDGLGRRVRSVIDSGSGPATDVYVYAGLSPIYETQDCQKFYYVNGMRIARVYGCSSSVEYYHVDALGNVRLVTDASGNRLATLAYKPFGLCAYGCASERTYGYTGAYRETTPNLVYLHSRWYDPTIGRFLSPDDRLGRLSMPQDQNRYAYVVNNPLVYTDPTGHILNVVIGAIAGAIIGGVGCWLAGGSDCLKAAAIGLAAGAVAGALFNPGAYAAMMAPTAATAGAYMAAGTVAAGLASGAAAGAASYLFAGGMATATGQPWEWSAEDLALSVVGGAAIGGITAGGSYVIGRGIAALRLRLAAAKAVTAPEAPRVGTDIVGTSHSEYRPTQWWVSRSKVVRIADALERGEQVDPIEFYESQGAKYIHDGHHRYVASQLTGIPVRMVEIDRPYSGYLQPLYDDWTSVHYRG